MFRVGLRTEPYLFEYALAGLESVGNLPPLGFRFKLGRDATLLVDCGKFL